MFIDLNVPVPSPSNKNGVPQPQSKKGKGKHPQQQPALANFTPAQIAALERRLDLLVQLGYTVFALNQTVQRRLDPKAHVDVLAALLPQLRARPGVVLLRRLTIVLDEESEKGFGLTSANTALVAPYDILALAPTTAAAFALACLTHTLPSALAAHVLVLPLAAPRLPFPLRHTLVRAALRNGAVFELAYAGALGADADGGGGGGGEGAAAAKRNWWAAAREVVRVTKGKGILVSGGAAHEADLRAPRDVANLATVLGLPQNVAHDAATKVPQSLILRAQTRRTYRAVLSEPKVVIPESFQAPASESTTEATHRDPKNTVVSTDVAQETSTEKDPPKPMAGKKRALEDGSPPKAKLLVTDTDGDQDGPARKKKKQKKAKEGRS